MTELLRQTWGRVLWAVILGQAVAAAAAEPDIPLTIATQNYGHTRALKDGTVKVPGCVIKYSTLPLADLNRQAFGPKTFDVTEVELLPFLTKWGTPETAEYALLPVFPLRDFQLRNIWIRTDRNIHSPQDLRGKTIAVPGSRSTEVAWIRGFLNSTAAVKPEEMTWIDAWKLADTDTWGLLAEGKADAAFDMRLPPKGAQNIGRLFPDYKRIEQARFAENRIFPIVSVLAVRKKLLAENPWLAEALFRAFCDAKRIAVNNLETEKEPKIPLPWGPGTLQETLDLMGKNYWSYGVPNNPRTLKAVLSFAHEVGIIPTQMKPADLFDLSTAQLFEN